MIGRSSGHGLVLWWGETRLYGLQVGNCLQTKAVRHSGQTRACSDTQALIEQHDNTGVAVHLDADEYLGPLGDELVAQGVVCLGHTCHHRHQRVQPQRLFQEIHCVRHYTQ